MIPSCALLALLAAGQTTSSTSASTAEGLERHRLPYETILDRTVGSASRAVRFDWRKTELHVGAFFAQPAEFNNFHTLRPGLVLRFPNESVLMELGLSYAFVSGTDSSRQLSLTPYRQAGRPDRFEIDFSVGIPLAEGVVTPIADFVPALEMVFSLQVNLRYLFYPNGFKGVGVGDALLGLLAPSLSDRELESLEDARLPGMELDPQRYHVLLGFGTDIYFESGLFLAPRLLFVVPLLEAATGSKMTTGLDFSFAAGVAF